MHNVFWLWYNAVKFNLMNKSCLYLFGLCLLFSACASAGPAVPSSTAQLRPYLSTTPSITATILAVTPQSLPTAAASATPWVHEISAEETLGFIAARYGVTLEALMAANPEVDPRFLIIGTTLMIPDPEGGSIQQQAATSTPVAMQTSTPVCYQQPLQRLLCITVVENTTDHAIEGLAGFFILYDEQGDFIQNDIVFAPLNLLLPGGSMPLVYETQLVRPQFSFAVMQLISAFPVEHLEDRYIELEVLSDVSTPVAESLSWHWQGKLAFPEIETDLQAQVTVLLLALDAQDIPLGYRIAAADTLIGAGDSADFELSVYSLGGSIDRILLLSEARLQQP